MSKQPFSLTLFYILVLSFIFPYKAYGSLPSYTTIPKEFLCKTKDIMSTFNSADPFFTRFSNANILIEKSDHLAIYISGKSPIVSTKEKETLQDRVGVEIVDIFDVISSPEDSLLTRNSLLAYAKYIALLSDLERLKKPIFSTLKGLFLTIEANGRQLVEISTNTPQLTSLVPLLQSILERFSIQKTEIDLLLAELQQAKQVEMSSKQERIGILDNLKIAGEAEKEFLKEQFNAIDNRWKETTKQVKTITDNLTKILKTLYEAISSQTCSLYSELQMFASTANKLYLSNIETYYKKLKIISPVASTSALFGLSILQKASPDIQIAYIVAPNRNTEQELRKLASDTTFRSELDDSFLLQWKLATSGQEEFWKIQPMYGIIKLSHTEPMYIFRNTTRGVINPYFFTQRDMCETCGPMIGKFAQHLHQPITVISYKSCTGQTGLESQTDYKYTLNTLIKNSEVAPIENICQVQISNLLTEEFTKDIIIFD